jgi:hypothetical protein
VDCVTIIGTSNASSPAGPRVLRCIREVALVVAAKLSIRGRFFNAERRQFISMEPNNYVSFKIDALLGSMGKVKVPFIRVQTYLHKALDS